ncbi:unnamed protein product, partial [Phaeothamnion confervicola]
YKIHPPVPGVKPENYVASAVLCYNAASGGLEWARRLDISVDEASSRAYVYASATVADIDGDSIYEVVIGTAAGALYVLNADTGDVRSGFPLRTGGEIHAQASFGHA